jgi:hypothetical protein
MTNKIIDWKQPHTVYSKCCGHPEQSHSDMQGEDEVSICNDCANKGDGWNFAALHEFEPIKLASGGVAGPDGYLDCLAAWLCYDHDECSLWAGSVKRAVWSAGELGDSVTTVATGAFGALFLEALNTSRNGLLWTPEDHGLPCSPFPPPPSGTKVVLIEDVVTTVCCEHEVRKHRNSRCVDCAWSNRTDYRHEPGGTIRRMRRWCEEQGYEIVGEVIASEL